jgi:hypothetical protein
MAEKHEDLLRRCRRRLLGGYQEAKAPTSYYRPDIYACKTASDGTIVREIVVEAEIESTLFSEHTSWQLTKMHGYLDAQVKKRKKVAGYLLIPKGNKTRQLAITLLKSLFPTKCLIKIQQE